jgi:uncharacterized membrane protein
MIKEMEMSVREKIKMVIEMNKIALAKILIPFGLVGATVLFFLLFLPEEFGRYVTVFSVYTFAPIIGMIAVIPTGLGLGIPPLALIAFIVYTDAILSMFLVWNFDYAKKIPGIGELVERVEERGEEALTKYKWAKRFGFIGLVVFVIFPLQWTGAGVGSILGRLIGMAPLMTWLAVILGTFIRSVIFVYFSWLITFLVKLFL